MRLRHRRRARLATSSRARQSSKALDESGSIAHRQRALAGSQDASSRLAARCRRAGELARSQKAGRL